jgi:hypothetical protein
MATRKTKNSDDEKLDAANLEKVIALLEPAEGKPISKKDACAMLCIAYNTTRLGTLIEKYKEKKAATLARRAALRGKPATPQEIQFIISSYLEGETVSGLAERSYRSIGFINQILEAHAVPLRAKAHDYFKPELIPEAAMQDRFKLEEVVYSARYDSVARIKSELFQNNQWVYCVWLMSDRWQQFAYQEAAELASLQHLRKLGVQV